MNNELAKKIKQICKSDIYEIGFAFLSGLLDSKWSKYSYGISFIRKLDNDIINEIEDGPTIEYYNHYNEINDELDKKTGEIVSLLKLNGIEAVAIKTTVEDEELDDEWATNKTCKYTHVVKRFSSWGPGRYKLLR
ncbi:MAG: hypothetical protein SVM80_08650 [Halobacteriota archaeon]|nr:hypothetical protein [Halobacteriota archaeon]